MCDSASPFTEHLGKEQFISVAKRTIKGCRIETKNQISIGEYLLYKLFNKDSNFQLE